jgi:hypothetical protein
MQMITNGYTYYLWSYNIFMTNFDHAHGKDDYKGHSCLVSQS